MPIFYIGVFNSNCWFCKWTTNALIRLRIRAVWSGHSLFAYAIRHLFPLHHSAVYLRRLIFPVQRLRWCSCWFEDHKIENKIIGIFVVSLRWKKKISIKMWKKMFLSTLHFNNFNILLASILQVDNPPALRYRGGLVFTRRAKVQFILRLRAVIMSFAFRQSRVPSGKERKTWSHSEYAHTEVSLRCWLTPLAPFWLARPNKVCPC